ncbi:UDP-rhamnose/UDP-galactose transporter 2-like [Apium graveolens]|uniref:UDP-rhamnose/UDP-galactose transporter 2-like n=1 Tax=Apium graveolens TaxID=4045 RepID=UPI003D795377
MQFIGSLQKKYTIGSFELLSKTAPIQAISLLILGPFVDYYISKNNILNYRFSYIVILFLLFSCFLAVFANISQYLCIRRFSAVSFQVLGHMKTICVLTLGWLLFDSKMTFKNIIGMVIAIGGMVIYSWADELEKQAKIASHDIEKGLTDDDVRLLKDEVEHSPLKAIEIEQCKV